MKALHSTIQLLRTLWAVEVLVDIIMRAADIACWGWASITGVSTVSTCLLVSLHFCLGFFWLRAFGV